MSSSNTSLGPRKQRRSSLTTRLPFVYTSFDTLVEDGRGEEERDGDVPMLETPAGRRGQRRAKKRMLELELVRQLPSSLNFD